MALGPESWLALVAAIIMVGPVWVLWRAFGRSRGRRVAWAASGVTLFFATDLLLFFDQLNPMGDASDYLGFAGDVATAACFAIAFLARDPVDG